MGVFNKTTIPLALVGYEIVDSQRGAVGYQPSHIPRSCSHTFIVSVICLQSIIPMVNSPSRARHMDQVVVARGSFLETPGNVSGPKSNFQIKI